MHARPPTELNVDSGHSCQRGPGQAKIPPLSSAQTGRRSGPGTNPGTMTGVGVRGTPDRSGGEETTNGRSGDPARPGGSGLTMDVPYQHAFLHKLLGFGYVAREVSEEMTDFFVHLWQHSLLIAVVALLVSQPLCTCTIPHQSRARVSAAPIRHARLSGQHQ